MTQVQAQTAAAVHRRPLRVLMASNAASAVGGLEVSFAGVVPELNRVGVVASSLVVGTPDAAVTTVAFLDRHLRTVTATGLRDIVAAVRRHDVVHVHGATAGLWPARVVAVARLCGVPVVVTLHLPAHPLPQPRLRGELRSRLRMAVRGLLLLGAGAAVYAPSSAAAVVARRQLRPWPVVVRRLWNGVADPGAAPVSASGPLRLVFVGRLSDHKRPLEFVAAVESASAAGADITADIVGDGPLSGEVRAAVEASPYRERFTVHGHADDPADVVRRCDLLVLTSMTEGGCPLVAMEAAAAGRGLLVRAGIEGVAEGWEGAYAGVPDSAEAAGFAAAIGVLAADRAAVAQLGAVARQRYDENFSAASAAGALRSAYDEAAP